MSDYSDIDPFHVHSDEYNRLWKLARANGWVIPANDAFPEHAWIIYWTGMDRLLRGEQRGRPVPPHRSG